MRFLRMVCLVTLTVTAPACFTFFAPDGHEYACDGTDWQHLTCSPTGRTLKSIAPCFALNGTGC